MVPKREEDYLFDLTDEELAGMMVFAKKVAKAIKKSNSLPTSGGSRAGLGCSTCSYSLGSFG